MPVRLATLAHGGRLHCTALAAAALLVTAAPASAQQAPPFPTPGDATFNVFIRGTQVGREQVTLSRTAIGLDHHVHGTHGGAGRLHAHALRAQVRCGLATDGDGARGAPQERPGHPQDVVHDDDRDQRDYAEQFHRLERRPDQRADGRAAQQRLRQLRRRSPPRLSTLAADAEMPVYIAPQTEIKVKVRSVTEQTLTGPGGAIPTRRYELTFNNPGGAVNAAVVIDDKLRAGPVRDPRGRAARRPRRRRRASPCGRRSRAIPPTPTSRSRPTVSISPARSRRRPASRAACGIPRSCSSAVRRPADRDQVIGGVPVFAQLARALADSGHVVLRYDRRGAGQSGGRTETATIADYADDVGVGGAMAGEAGRRRQEADRRRGLWRRRRGGADRGVAAQGDRRRGDARRRRLARRGPDPRSSSSACSTR